MFRITTAAAAAVAMIAIAAPATSQTMIDQLISRVRKPRTAAVAASAPGDILAMMTAGQSAAMDRVLATPLNDPKVAADRVSGTSLIRNVLSVAACARNGTAFNALNRDSLAPKTYEAGGGGYANEAPMRNMKYHDGNACLDVVRVAEWSKPAMNALRFKAFYVAADSGEAANQVFEIQKDSDGRWLVRRIELAMM